MFTLAGVTKSLNKYAIEVVPSKNLEIKDDCIKICGTDISLYIGGNYIKYGPQSFKIIADVLALLKSKKILPWENFNLIKKSKYSWHAFDVNNKKIASGPSIPKLKEKLKPFIKPKKLLSKKTNTRPAKQPGKASIKSMTMDFIIAGENDKSIIDKIKSHYPDSKFDQRHISWYRSTLYRDGVITAEFAPRKSKAYKQFKSQQEKK